VAAEAGFALGNGATPHIYGATSGNGIGHAYV
jgi:hypothetical protein